MSIDPAIIRLKLNKAFECIEEAQLLFETGHYNTVVNRLYYAVFYGAVACLLKHEVVTKSHSGTKNQFHLAFVKTKMVTETTGKLYDNLFNQRNESDYGDFVIYEKEDVGYLIGETENCLKEIRSFIGNGSN
jgi:uncharacterized protein (UPF0332 family)